MHRLRKVAAVAWVVTAAVALAAPSAAAGREERRSPLFIFLHEIQPLEQLGGQARDAGEDAEAYRLYLRALRKYQGLDAAVGNWGGVQPQGLEHLVREGLARCEVAVGELRVAAEAEDAHLQKLTQLVKLDVHERHLREVARVLTDLTDVNIIVQDSLFPDPGPDPNVTLRVEQGIPLLQVIRLMVQQKGLAYSVEEDLVYIGTRTGVDGTAGYNTTAWFHDR